MTVNVNWSNPYEKRKGNWFKGNLHTHTSASACAIIPVKDCIDLYVARGYDFIALSDHMTYTPYQDDRITMLKGIEWNDDKGACHTGVYFVSEDDLKLAVAIADHDELLSRMAEIGAVTVLNHPNWQLRPHYRREELEQKRQYDGIEIYNAIIERADGCAISTEKWDYLLTKDHKALGFANDDSHRASDIGLASIYVRSAANSPEDIIASIRSGNFYSSSGALIDDIRMENGVIELETPSGQEIQVSGECGHLIQRVWDRSVKFNTNGVDTPYVRFTVFGQGSSMAWTQPFFIAKPSRSTKRPH